MLATYMRRKHNNLEIGIEKNTDVMEIVSQLEIADAIFSAGETRAEKSVCSRRK